MKDRKNYKSFYSGNAHLPLIGTPLAVHDPHDFSLERSTGLVWCLERQHTISEFPKETFLLQSDEVPREEAKPQGPDEN